MITLICSTYNKPEYLKFVLDSIKYQSLQNFELIIADDGSTEETERLVRNFELSSSIATKYLWHEDIGRRKSVIHNKALKIAKGKLIIFIDGDCILAPNFVRDHFLIYQKHKENYVLMGRRVELGPLISKTLTLQNYHKTLQNDLLISCLRGDSRGFFRKFSIKNNVVRKLIGANNVYDLLGCNFSLSKKSLELINGFNVDDEKLHHWGEDGDIFIRLKNTEHQLIGMKYFAVMYHIWHQRKTYLSVDQAYKQKLLNKEYKICTNGLDQTNLNDSQKLRH